MAPVARNPVFRRDEERKAAEVLGDLDSDYRSERPGAPRPTVSVLVAKLQAIRNHPVARQKRRYLEALAEKVLDERTDREQAAAAAAAAGNDNGAPDTAVGGVVRCATAAAGTGVDGAAADGATPNGTATHDVQNEDAVMTTPPAAGEVGAEAEVEAEAQETTTPTAAADTAARADATDVRSADAPVVKRRVRRPRLEPNGEVAAASGKPAANGTRGSSSKVLRKRKRRRYESTGGSSSSDENDSDDDARVGSAPHTGGGERRKRGVVATAIPPNGPTLQDVAGMDDILIDFVQLIWMPLRCGRDFASSGCRPNEAVLLYGPSGCGKTLLANVLAAEVGVPFFSVSGPSLVGGISGESETNIRNIFDEAIRQAPSLIFVDEIEALAGKQDLSGKGPMETRMALTLANCIDRLSWEPGGGGGGDGDGDGNGNGNGNDAGKYVIMLAATNKADSLDPIVRRRFGVEIAVRMPSQDAREKILRTMTRGMKLASDVDLAEVARRTPGFVGGDLRNVVKTAQLNFMNALLQSQLAQLRAAHGMQAQAAAADADAQSYYRLLKAREEEQAVAAAAAALPSPSAPSSVALATPGGGDDDDDDNNNDSKGDKTSNTSGISAQHFCDAAASVLPAAKREGFSTIPNTTWSQVGAMTALRKRLEMSIIGPIRYPAKYAAVGQKPVGGILLWGPPGCGKTLVAKAVANESKANFISIRGPELLNKWVGESERALRELFERARAMAPCIIFFDEMDALAAKRDDARSDGSARIVNTLLTELDGVVDRVGLFVIGATNRPDIIDPAIKRPGRLGESIFVGPPTAEDRVAILQTLYRNAVPHHDRGDGGDGDDNDDNNQEGPSTMEVLAGVAMDARCTGFSGADLDQLLRAAGKHSLERTGLHSAEVPRITREDWEVALQETQPSTSLADLRRYEKLL
ncbi:aaa family ATPase rvb2 [Niveomyces insectorum RCEF 264]|uniref:Aaa family ATPase rvb2 n=1 Tax=Niveomyces insectorum RCEF 264 TaxID=1081102 RepID=A0A168AIE2_9HYPO|nr:aaa family ATPase rvb2 [Niveomyces insectorum RCEF 264]